MSVEEKVKFLQGEIGSTIDDRLQRAPLVLAGKVQQRTGIAGTDSTHTIDLFEDLIGIDNHPLVKDITEWESLSSVLFSSGSLVDGLKVRQMAALLQRTSSDPEARNIGVAIFENPAVGFTHTIRLFKGGNAMSDVLSGTVVVHDISSESQLEAVKNFIDHVGPIIPQLSPRP